MIQDPIYVEAFKNCPENMMPIFYVKIKYVIKIRKTETNHMADKIVVKGTFDMIKKSRSTKLAIAKTIYKDDKDSKKKAFAFDLNKIIIRSVEIKHFMSYGIR